MLSEWCEWDSGLLQEMRGREKAFASGDFESMHINATCTILQPEWWCKTQPLSPVNTRASFFSSPLHPLSAPKLLFFEFLVLLPGPIVGLLSVVAPWVSTCAVPLLLYLWPFSALFYRCIFCWNRTSVVKWSCALKCHGQYRPRVTGFVSLQKKLRGGDSLQQLDIVPNSKARKGGEGIRAI